MEKMKELYEKVAKDNTLQAKFKAILSDAEKAGETATGKKLASFAKEAGFDVTLEEMREFFKALSEKQEGALSDPELDMVAGGKSTDGRMAVAISVISFGIGCLILSAGAEAVNGECKDVYD